MVVRHRIAVQVGMHDPYWVQVREAVIRHASQRNVEVVQIGTLTRNITNLQLLPHEIDEFFEELLVQDVHGLICNTVAETLLRRIVARGIPIIDASESFLRYPLFTSRRGLYDAAHTVGHWLAERLQPDARVLVVGGYDDMGLSRLMGIKDALATVPTIQLIHIPCEWLYHDGVAATEVWVNSDVTPIDAVFGLSDSLASAGRDVLALSIAASMLLVACGGAAAPAAEPTAAPEAAAATEAPAATEATAAPAADAVTIRYGLWDGNQQPAYEACAAAFTAENPGITVKVEQAGWGDYWNGVQTGMVSDTAPDVFTNHLAKYPEFASKEQLVDLKPFIDRDGVDTNQYLAGLADLWGRDGKTYGLPKDWDTIAVVYNQDMLDKAGVTVDELNNADWNAKDGGSFGQIIKKLTLDANGKNALDADFDKTTVVQYGFIPGGSGGAYGQTQWSHWAVSNGFKFNDGLYATKYYYDDPKLAETIQWYANLNLVDGVAPTLADVKSLGANALFTGGKGALTTDGSWMIGAYTKDTKFKTGFARLPKGPEGRKSMFNGLADSIWVGSKHQEESWQWLKFASSPACENIVGSYGVVFPAVQSGVDAALAAYTAKGIDVSAFTAQATEANGTFLFPVTDYASEIGPIMDALMDSIMLGEKTAVDGLKEGNDQVNALFQ